MSERDTVRRCLRQWGLSEQRAGAIPKDVSEAEIFFFTDQFVDQILEALHENAAMYEHVTTAPGHSLEDYLSRTIAAHLSTSSFQPHPDQAVYHLRDTGETLAPMWTHRNCGGDVYPTTHDAFTCARCHKTGSLGAEMPDGLSKDEQMHYLLTDVSEVDLT